jgi:hypothetical protein
MFDFLGLPTELRFMVYREISDPLTACVSDYKGMYLSCRQLKAEMDQECPKPLARYLETEGGPEPGQLNLRLMPLPQEPHFCNIRKLRVSFELGDWLANWTSAPFFHFLLRPRWVGTDAFFASNPPRLFNMGSLAPLRLESVTFVITLTGNVSARPYQYSAQIGEIVETMCREIVQAKALPNVNRFEFVQSGGWGITVPIALHNIWKNLRGQEISDWRFLRGWPTTYDFQFVCERTTGS